MHFLFLFLEHSFTYKPQGFRLHTHIISCSAESNNFHSPPSDSDDIYVQGIVGEFSAKKRTIW